jgi:3-oxoacyl-[acyl-carrier protein] reductase
MAVSPVAGGSGEDRRSIEGHRAIVIGAGDGIGRHAALLLAQRGVQVACLDRDGERATATATETERIRPGSLAVTADVTDADGLVSGIDGVIQQFGGLEILLNCAGITGMTNLKSHEVPVSDFDRVVAINLRGAFLASRAVLPTMVAAGYGRVLHVASIAGKEGNAGMVAYSATKAGLIGMVKSQGKEYATTGVTINALAPAVILTALVEAMPPEQVAYMTSRIPMGRCGTLDEVAEMIAWIVSPACSYSTGFTFDLSGGRAVY